LEPSIKYLNFAIREIYYFGRTVRRLNNFSQARRLLPRAFPSNYVKIMNFTLYVMRKHGCAARNYIMLSRQIQSSKFPKQRMVCESQGVYLRKSLKRTLQRREA
jgi:hypothetical protein